jgi:Ca2+-binding RTX toxin-like protein
MANIGGTNGDDIISGTALNDRINGGAGDDTIYGGAGNDILIGGLGNDYLDGGLGVDYIIGGAGNDSMLGREGVDTFAFWFTSTGGGSTNVPEGTKLSDVVTLTGSEGYDTILDFDWRAGGDKLDFNGMTSGQYDWLVASNQITYSHADYNGDGNTDMLISYLGGSILLSGITETKIDDLAALKSMIMFDPG